MDVRESILAHVANAITSSGRELEGAFNQLMFRRGFEPDLDIGRVDALLGHLVNTGEPKRVRIEDIQRVVSRHFNVSRQELVSNRRTRVIVKPRQVAMHLAKTMTPRSFPEIGRRFCGRDHTTVLHAVQKIEDLMNKDSKLSHEVELLKRLINEQVHLGRKMRPSLWKARPMHFVSLAFHQGNRQITNPVVRCNLEAIFMLRPKFG